MSQMRNLWLLRSGEVTRLPARTPLAQLRAASGLRQEQLADLVGVSRATIQRLEMAKLKNPPVRVLVNCALVLDVPLEEILGDWGQWTVFDARRPGPPTERQRAKFARRRAGADADSA